MNETKKSPVLQEVEGGPCVSIIMPMNKISQDRLQNKPRLNNLLRKANKLLRAAYPHAAEHLIPRLKALAEEVDFTHPGEGIGIYLSPKVYKHYKFDYPVPERVMVAETFEVRDILHEISMPHDYYVLVVGTKRTRLFKNTSDGLDEVKNDKFPMGFVDTYEYQKPSISSGSTNGHTRTAKADDKHSTEKMRVNDWLRNLSGNLGDHLNGEPLVFIIAVEQQAAVLQQEPPKGIKLGGISPKGLEKLGVEKVQEILEPMVKEYVEREKQEALEAFKSKIATGLTAFGVEGSWDACMQGNCMYVFVEEGFTARGCISPDGTAATTKVQRGWRQVPDLVDDLLENAIHHNARVIFMPDGSLEEYERVATLKRYVVG